MSPDESLLHDWLVKLTAITPDDRDSLTLHEAKKNELTDVEQDCSGAADTLHDELPLDTEQEVEAVGSSHDIELDPHEEHDSDASFVPTDTESDTDVKNTLHDKLDPVEHEDEPENEEHERL